MTDTSRATTLLEQLDHLNAQQLRRLLVEHLTKQKLGLYWEANAIERDAALNADLVLPRLVEEWSCAPSPLTPLPAGEGNKLPLLSGEGWGEGQSRSPTATSSLKATISIRCVYCAVPTPEKSVSSTLTRRTTPATRTGFITTITSARTTAGGIRSGWSFCIVASRWHAIYLRRTA